jgi:hypothetical protein
MAAFDQYFQEDLLSDESIQWSGQPIASVLFSRRDVLLIPFSLLWCGFAFFWEYSVLFSPTSFKGGEMHRGMFALFGLPFVLIGFYLTMGRFFLKYFSRKNTYYALTNQRVLILEINKGRKRVQSYFMRDIPGVHKEIGSNGIGSIVFGPFALQALMYQDSGFSPYRSRMGIVLPAFYDIQDANQVYDLANNLQIALK